MKKALCVLYYGIFALPIPVSIITWIGTLISVANIGAIGGEGISGIIHKFVALLCMLLAGTYLISYAYSLYRTKKVKKLTFAFFLPILHIVLTIICIYGWICFDKM